MVVCGSTDVVWKMTRNGGGTCLAVEIAVACISIVNPTENDLQRGNLRIAYTSRNENFPVLRPMYCANSGEDITGYVK